MTDKTYAQQTEGPGFFMFYKMQKTKDKGQSIKDFFQNTFCNAPATGYTGCVLTTDGQLANLSDQSACLGERRAQTRRQGPLRSRRRVR